MSGEMNDTVLLTLMHELQIFVRDHMEQPEVMAELRHWMASPAGMRASALRTADLVRAFELLAPGLMADFLEANSEILNPAKLRRWASEREWLHEGAVNMSA